MAKFYVYTLAHPNGQIFYVGKGVNRRIARHEYEARQGCTCEKCEHIRSIWAAGEKVVRTVVFESRKEADALDYECRLIASIGRENLFNKTNGGEGQAQVPGGIVSTQQFRREMREWVKDALEHTHPKERRRRRAELQVATTRAEQRATEDAEWIEERVNEVLEYWRENRIKGTRKDAYRMYGYKFGEK